MQDNGKIQLGLRPDKYERHSLALRILRALPRGAIAHLVVEAILFYAEHHDILRYPTTRGERVFTLAEGIQLPKTPGKMAAISPPKKTEVLVAPVPVPERNEADGDALDAAIGFFEMMK